MTSSPRTKTSRGLTQVLSCLLVSLVLLGSCGLPTDEAPRLIPSAELPAELSGQALPTPVTDVPETPIYWLGSDNRLFRTTRPVEPDPDPSTQAFNLLQELILGTRPAEVRRGIISAISTDTEIRLVLLGEDGVLYIDLAEGTLTSSSFENRRVAYAQIVWTMTELPFVDKVLFLIDDRLASVPIDGGQTGQGVAVDRSQYPSLDPAGRIAFPDETQEEPAVVIPVLPTPINAIPEGLLDEPNPEDIGKFDLAIWMIDREGKLVTRPRSTERDPGQLLEALFEGPTASEATIGIRTAVLPTSAVISDISVDETSGTAFIDLGNDSLPAFGPDNERLRALGQIVYTMTELAEIEFVAITVLGNREPLPTQDGLTEAGAVLTREDFAVLLAQEVIGIATPTPDPADTDGADGPSDADEPEPPASPEADPTATPTVTPTTTPTTTPTAAPAPTPSPTPTATTAPDS